jgi:hypothetical protein
VRAYGATGAYGVCVCARAYGATGSYGVCVCARAYGATGSYGVCVCARAYGATGSYGVCVRARAGAGGAVAVRDAARAPHQVLRAAPSSRRQGAYGLRIVYVWFTYG